MKGKRALILMAFVLAFCALLLVTVSTTSSAESGQLHTNVKAGDMLHPETKGDPDAAPESRYVQADYNEMYPGGPRSSKQWVTVGTWTSSSREVNFTIDGGVTFNVWYQIIDEGYSAGPEFRFTIRADGLVLIETTGPEGPDPGDDSIIEYTVSDNVAPREISKDEELSLEIEYQAFEDCNIYFDNASYDSGFQSEVDFLQTFNMSARGSEVTLEVYDAFSSDWEEVKNYLELTVDGEAAGVEDITTEPGGTHTIYGEEITGTLITWTLEEPLNGSEEVEAWVKYTRADDGEDKGLKKTVTASSGEPQRPMADIHWIKPGSAAEGEEVNFDARDSHDEDGTVDIYVWKSNIDDELYNGSNSSFMTTGLSVGDHTISLVVQDNDGLWSAEETKPLTINPNTKPEIELTYPADDETITTTFTTLEWEGEDEDDDDLSYDVYLDTKQNPDTMVAEGITREDHDVEELEDGRTYYWKVVVSDGKAETESEIWRFMVRLPSDNTAPTIQLSTPSNGTTFTTNSVTLSWEGHDDDGDSLVYDVYLHTDPEAGKKVSSGQSGESYEVTTLEPGKSYYWKVVVSDGEEEISSRIWRFTVEKKDSDDDDDDFEIAGTNGYVVVGTGAAAAVVIAVVAFFIIRRREEEDEDEYDEDEDEEYYM